MDLLSALIAAAALVVIVIYAMQRAGVWDRFLNALRWFLNALRSFIEFLAG